MISIITITYNNFEELKATLHSLSHVPPQIAEVVIINGGKCPQTKEFLEHLSLPLKMKIVQEADKGITDAFNKGIRYATGSAITFLNSGDKLLRADYYTQSYQILRERPEVSFIHSNILYDDSLCGPMVVAPRQCSLGRGMPFHHQTMIVRSEIFRQIGTFNEKYKIVMDYDFTVRMVKAQLQGYYLDLLPPPIQMDGHGVSATKEIDSIRESKSSLISHRLFYPWQSFPIFISYQIRYTLFSLRRLLHFLKLDSLIRYGKLLKNSYK